MQEKAIFITTGLTHGTLSVFILFICGFFLKKKILVLDSQLRYINIKEKSVGNEGGTKVFMFLTLPLGVQEKMKRRKLLLFPLPPFHFIDSKLQTPSPHHHYYPLSPCHC